MMDRPWDRLRTALHREPSTSKHRPRPLPGVSSQDFRGWAKGQNLQVRRVAGEDPEPGVYATGGHRLGEVRARCLVDHDTAEAVGVDVSVTGTHAGAPPDLTAFLLDPVAPALQEPQRSAADAWVRGQLSHRGPYNAATTLGGLQVAVAVDDADPGARTWSLTVRGSPAPAR